MAIDYELLNLQRRALDRLWRPCWDFRGKHWDPMVHRRGVVSVQPVLRQYGQDVNFQSPLLEKVISDFVKICDLEPTKIDAQLMEEEPKDGSLKNVRSNKIWYGSQIRRTNVNRRLDRHRSRGQAQYGYAVERLLWEMPEEDGDDDVFDIEIVHPLSYSQLPIHGDPEIAKQETVMTIVEARKIKNSDGQALDWAQDSGLYFCGDKEPFAQWQSKSEYEEKRVHLVTIAYLKKGEEEDDDQWWICEYAYPGSGGDGSTIPEEANGVLVSEKLVPFNRCPFFLIPSPNYNPLESDPHLAFRPLAYELYVHVATKNWLDTTIALLALRNSTAVVVTLDGLDPQWMSWLEEMFGAEGEGASRGLVFKPGDPNTGEFRIFPHVEKLPTDLDQALMELQRQNIEDIKNAIDSMTSRFQTGQVSRTEVAESKAQSFVDASQASRLQPEAALQIQCSMYVAECDAMRAAIIYWDTDESGDLVPVLKKYNYATTGEESIRGGVAPGQVGFVDAESMSTKHQTYAFNWNRTQSEQQQAELTAYQRYKEGVIDQQQLIEQIGQFDDVDAQLLRLEKEQQRKDLEPAKRQLITNMNTAAMNLLSGLQAAALAGATPPTPPVGPGLGQDTSFPGGVEMTPPRSGSGPPNWKPDFMAEQQQAPVRQPQPAVMPSPQGLGQQGSNPMAGR